MSAYNGQALVIAPAYPSREPRQLPGRPPLQLGGTLTPAREGQSRLLNLTAGTLQLPNGTAAEFLCPDTSDLVSTNRMRIIGQDVPPF
jgi:hypothetical protein